MNGDQRPGWYFTYAQDDLSRYILLMFEGTFSLDVPTFQIFQSRRGKMRLWGLCKHKWSRSPGETPSYNLISAVGIHPHILSYPAKAVIRLHGFAGLSRYSLSEQTPKTPFLATMLISFLRIGDWRHIGTIKESHVCHRLQFWYFEFANSGNFENLYKSHLWGSLRPKRASRVIQQLLVLNVHCTQESFLLESIFFHSLRKHVRLKILKISPPKTESFQIKILIFFIFLLKT